MHKILFIKVKTTESGFELIHIFTNYFRFFKSDRTSRDLNLS